jgi:hypothetical protein
MRFVKAEDAVSESVGFVIIVSIIMTAMAMVLMIGYPMFINSVNEAHMQNVEEGFYLMSTNANKVILFESPIQSSELRMNGGTISLREDGYINVSYEYYNYTTSAYEPDDDNRSITVLEYQISDQRVAYIMGGVCRKNGDSSVMLHDPLIYMYNAGTSNATLFVPLILYQNDIGAIAWTGLAQVTFESPYYSKELSTLKYPEPDRKDRVRKINITMQSDYNDCFSRYFKSLGFNPTITPGGLLTMEQGYSPDISLYVPRSDIAVQVT